jgi:hypothetical protein
MSVGAVLGVSLSATRAGVVVLEGVGAEARTVIRDAVAVSGSGMQVVAAAVAQAARTAADRGYPVYEVGLTCTADAVPHGLELAALLADSDLAEIEAFEPTDAVVALAEAIAESRRSRCATVGLVAEDKIITVLADSRDGVYRTAVSPHHDDDHAVASLAELVADGRSGAVFVMVPHALAIAGFSERLERALAPRMIALVDAELGLARGVALAAGNAVPGDVVAAGRTMAVRERLRRPDALLIAAVAVTLLVAVLTVVLVRGFLVGVESPAQMGSSVGVDGDEVQSGGQGAVPPSSAVAPPVTVAAGPSAVAPPVPVPDRAEPEVVESGEVQLRKMTEPVAESAPAPVAPPVGVPPPAPVEEPSPLQGAIAFVEQALGIDVDNDGLIGDRAAPPTPAPDQAP